jgi:hypothetical protein
MQELRIPVSTADSAGGAQALTSAGADSAGGAQALTSAGADSAGGAQALTSAGADSAGGAQALISAGAESAGAKVLTSAEAKALLFRVQLAEEQRQAALAKQKGGKGKGPILGGPKRRPRYRP